jgi:hypothetical protein
VETLEEAAAEGGTVEEEGGASDAGSKEEGGEDVPVFVQKLVSKVKKGRGKVLTVLACLTERALTVLNISY